jgi:hypothetical protein
VGETEIGAHYVLWSKLFGDLFDDYGTVIKNKTGMFPAFGSRATKEHFENWFETYKNTFFRDTDVLENVYPKPKSGNLNGTWIEDRPDRTVEEDWMWISKHYRNPVVRVDTGWLFSNETDAIHFKMR